MSQMRKHTRSFPGCLKLAAVLLLAMAGAPAQEPGMADVARLRAAASRNRDLSGAEKTQVLELYDAAQTSLDGVLHFRAVELGQQRKKADVEREASILQAELLKPNGSAVPPEDPHETAQAVDDLLDRAASERNARQRALADLSRAAVDVNKRLGEISQRRTELRLQSESVEDQLAVLEMASGSEEWETATQVQAQCRKRAIEAELAALNAEREALDAVQAVMPLQRDAAKLRLEASERTLEVLNRRRRVARARDASRELEHARQVAQQASAASPALRQTAAEVMDLSERLWGTSGVVLGRQDIADVTERLKRQTVVVKDVAAAVQRRYAAAGRFAPVSDWMQRLPASAPRTEEAQRIRRQKLAGLTGLRRSILALEEQRLNEATLETQVDRVLAKSPGIKGAAAAELEGKVRAALQFRRNLVENLYRNSQDLDTRLTEFNAVSAEYLKQLAAFRTFVRQRVLWSPSVTGLPSPHDCGQAAVWLAWNRDWKETLLGSVTGSAAPMEWPAAVLSVVLLFLMRRWLPRRQTGLVLRTPGRALLKSLVFAVGPAAAVLWAGYLIDSAEAPPLAHAIRAGCSDAAVAVFLFLFLRHALGAYRGANPNAHWPEPIRREVLDALKWPSRLIPALWFLTAAFAEVGGVVNEDPALRSYHNSLGRAAFVSVLILLTAGVLRLLRPGSAVAEEIRTRRGSLRWRLAAQRIWLGGLVLAPAVLALSGFYTTSVLLVRNVFWTALLSVALGIVGRLALRGLRQRKRDLLGKGLANSDVAEADETQVEQLSRFAVLLIWTALSLVIWSRVLPALSLLDRVPVIPAAQTTQTQANTARPGAVPLAPLPVQPGSVPAPEAPIPALSLLAALKALAAAAITIVLVKNVPGLIHFFILNRFRLDSGAVYAIGTIARYVVIMAGLGVVSGILGIDWSHVQWLAAALTFGVGFGLQEIFANFASGLILLLDRSVRVGDAVSVGELSGRVSRIQMRATTVTLWDRSEMIVPNKEFITSKLVNWTLSLPESRVDVKVGVAYGSDLDLVRKVLNDVAAANPNVLRVPAPEVLLVSFADSAIAFELRVFCLYEFGRLKVLDQLHVAVYKAFEEHGIAIAFPQLDVHLDTPRGANPKAPD